MADITVYLLGGPCGGTDKTLTQAQFDSHHTTCRGALYTYNAALGAGFELPVFAAPGVTSTGGSGSGVSPDTYSPGVHRAWGHVQIEVNRNLPSVLKAIRKATRQSYADLRHKRRVRG